MTEAVTTPAKAASIPARLEAVRQRIADAAGRASRDPQGVTLVAVGKTHPVPVLLEAIAAGVDALGENRVQDAVEKIEAIGRTPEWHLIGSLQTNKARIAVDHFDVIHSLDRIGLARAISSRATAIGRRSRVLVQVNVTGSPTQGGVAPGDLEGLVRAALVLPGIAIDGLMCIAPEAAGDGGVAAIRTAFRMVAARWRDLATLARDHGHPWHHLSMGMTGDFEVAIEEGATIVRVGRAIFGDRST